MKPGATGGVPMIPPSTYAGPAGLDDAGYLACGRR